MAPLFFMTFYRLIPGGSFKSHNYNSYILKRQVASLGSGYNFGGVT